jgi:hypothetical protein
MALHGKISKVQKGANKIAETNDWSLDTDAGLVEIPTHQLEWMKRLGGIKDWTASIDALLDMTAAQQTIIQDLVLGTIGTATFSFYMNATSYYSGPGYVESISMGAPAEDAESITFNISCDGTLAYNAS